MSNSRRTFLKIGTLATLFAAVPFKSVFGQGWKDRDGNPANNPPAQTDPLANYSKATFKTYLNSIFQLHTINGIVEVTLLQVGDMPSSKGGECFTLLFRGGARPQRQDTYTMVHAALGTFQLMLVPSGTDQNGSQGYLATINRLSYADAALMSVPTKQAGATQPVSMPSVTPAAAPNIAPGLTPSTVPSVTPIVPSVTPAAAPASSPTPSMPVVTPAVTPTENRRRSKRKPRKQRTTVTKKGISQFFGIDW